MAEATSPVRDVHVAVGVIVRDGRVLIARRPDHVHQGGLLEFPGGKVEPGETVQQALVRELAEETALEVPEQSLEPLIGIRHDYGDKRVFLDVWRSVDARGEAIGREGQPVDWLPPEALRDEDFPAANRPIIRALRLPQMLAITGPAASSSEALERLKKGLPTLAGPSGGLVVLRAPELGAADYRSLAAQTLALAHTLDVGILLHGQPSVLADHPGAAGLHLPWREAARLDRRPVPDSVWLGVSCHNEAQLAHAEQLAADYVTLGPVQPTASHPGQPTLGWASFQTLAARARCPVYGLGGLGPQHLNRARASGAQGIAGIRFWWPNT